MLRKLIVGAMLLAPSAALAGDGGGWSDNGALLIQAIGRLIGKLASWF